MEHNKPHRVAALCSSSLRSSLDESFFEGEEGLQIPGWEFMGSFALEPGARDSRYDLTKRHEEVVLIVIRADADPQALGIAGIGHQPDQNLAVLERLEGLWGGR